IDRRDGFALRPDERFGQRPHVEPFKGLVAEVVDGVVDVEAVDIETRADHLSRGDLQKRKPTIRRPWGPLGEPCGMTSGFIVHLWGESKVNGAGRFRKTGVRPGAPCLSRKYRSLQLG